MKEVGVELAARRDAAPYLRGCIGILPMGFADKRRGAAFTLLLGGG